MAVLAAIVDGDALVDVVWTSLLAGIGVTATFAIAILGATRAADLGRDGRVAEAVLFGVLGALAVVAVAAAVAFGIVVMTSK
jgi:hypothetical protein